MQIRERSTAGWRTTTLEPRALTRDIEATVIHGQTHQDLHRTILETAETVYVHPKDQLGPTDRPPFWEPGDPPATTLIWNAEGMLCRIAFDDRDALGC